MTDSAPDSTLASEERAGRPADRSGWPRWSPRRLAMPETQLFLLLAMMIGLFSGLAFVLFHIAINWTRLLVLGSGLSPAWPRVILGPAAAGIVVALLVIWVFPQVRGSGVNQTKAAVYIYDGYIPFSTVIGKFLTCALAIGSGQSLGPEDPSLQMGAGIASALGRRLEFSRERLRLLAPVGAAAGLAAAFNAPISAVLFVIEEVIGTWSAGGLGAIVLAAVSSVVVMRWFLGSAPLFRVAPYHPGPPSELLAYAALGVAGGFASLLFARFIAYARPRLHNSPRWLHYALPGAAGCVVGVIGLWFPQVMGAGYVYIDQALHDQYTWEVLAILGLLKIFATGICFSSGTPGGMFAPTLFAGAMVGGAIGGLEHHFFFHHLSGSVGPFALVGMGTLFAGFLRTPITSVFMVVEVSGSYSIILPVMISNTIAYLIARHYQRVPLFDLLTRQDGLELPSLEELREREAPRIEQAMRSPEAAPALAATDSLARALELADAAEDSYVLVGYPDGRWAAVSRVILHQHAADARNERAVGEVIEPAWLPLVHPDQPLEVALGPAQEWPLVPVVSRADPRRLEGVLTLSDVLAAYRRPIPD
jgi:chloride channel protein, CIC family